MQIAFAKGSLVVAASGNEFAQGNPVIFPAAYPHVLSVASLDPTLKSSGFSSANAAVDVAAPGVDVPVATPAAFDTEDGVVDGVTLGQRDELRRADRLRRRRLAGHRAPRPLQRPARRRAAPLGARRRARRL